MGKEREAPPIASEELSLWRPTVDIKLASRTLSGHVVYARGRYAGVQKKRITKAKQRADRILASPLEWKGKVQALETAAAPVLAYGAEIAEYTQHELRAVSSSFLHAWWGRKRAQRVPVSWW